MCFYDDDCDWTATIYEDEVSPVTEAEAAPRPVKCDECGRVIEIGGWRRHIFMQQHEVCRHDPDHDGYDPEQTAADLGVDADSLPREGCPEGCSHDYGEEASYDRCEACEQLIEAIHQHELSVGCREYESRPNLEQLYDAMHEGEGKVYLAKAEALFPGITRRLAPSFVSGLDGHEGGAEDDDDDEFV